MSTPRIMIVGAGHHGRGIARLVLEHGMELAAVVDPALRGQSVEAALGLVSRQVIDGTVEEALGRAPGSIDVAILAPRGDFRLFESVAVECVRACINVLTVIEDAFYPWRDFAESADELDALARRHEVSVAATGVQDMAWTKLVVAAAGTVVDLTRLTVRQHHGVDTYPMEFLSSLGIGSSEDEFDDAVKGVAAAPSLLGSALLAIADHLGLAAGHLRRELLPIRAPCTIPSVTFGRDFSVGQIIGLREIATLDTQAGIELLSEHDTTVRRPGSGDVFEAVLEATPRTVLTHVADPGPAVIDATVLYRIYDVIDAASGYLRPDELPPVRFRLPSAVLTT